MPRDGLVSERAVIFNTSLNSAALPLAFARRASSAASRASGLQALRTPGYLLADWPEIDAQASCGFTALPGFPFNGSPMLAL